VLRLAALAELEQLEPVLVRVSGEQFTLVRIDDEVFAFAATCTHREAPLADGAVTRKRTVLCPWHLGTFDLRTGQAKAGPPRRPMRVYPVSVVSGVAYLDTDRTELAEPAGSRGAPDAERDLSSPAGCHAVRG
jgi:nitrite reductase/ring-hydroxylating ferredoxin subunit